MTAQLTSSKHKGGWTRVIDQSNCVQDMLRTARY